MAKRTHDAFMTLGFLVGVVAVAAASGGCGGTGAGGPSGAGGAAPGTGGVTDTGGSGGAMPGTGGATMGGDSGGATGTGGRNGSGGGSGSSTGGNSDFPTGGNKGSGGAGGRACDQVQCLRAYQCVRTCGGPVAYTGCCPCEAPLFDNFGNAGCGGATGAGGVVGSGGGTGGASSPVDAGGDGAADCGCPDSGYPVCGGDQKNYPSACAAACVGVAIVDGCACGKPDGSFCGCTTGNVDLICGTDGNTWTNACLASQAGVGVQAVGVCGTGARRGSLEAGATCDRVHQLCGQGLMCCQPAIGTALPDSAPLPFTCTVTDPTSFDGCPRGA